MPPKKGKKGGGKKSNAKKPTKKGNKKQKVIEIPEIFFAKDDVFDEELVIIGFEYSYECPIFAEKATEVFDYIAGAITKHKLQLILNNNDMSSKPNKVEPRRGTFEISVYKNARAKPKVFWTGIVRGPPRRDKFPNAAELDELVSEIKKYLMPAFTEPDFTRRRSKRQSVIN